MKIRIETYHPGPTEVRIKNLNSRSPSSHCADKPGVSASEVSGTPGVLPFPGMKTLGQAAFGVLKTANAARKIRSQE